MIWAVGLVALGACGLGCTADNVEDYVHGEDEEMGDSVLGEEAGAAPGVRVPSTVTLDRRGVFYLTFDDGPSPRYTRRILQVLAAHRAPATFFTTGANLAGNEAIVREIEAAGHIVASHQWSHVVATTEQLRTWAPRQRARLDEILGHAHTRYFRYPYGSGSTAKEAVLREAGYPDGGIGWDVDTLDWCYASGTCSRAPAAFRSNFTGFVMSEARRRGGGVILFHDIQGVTANNLDAILTQMEAAGYRFANLPTAGR
ncbi:MAG: polysaccharide deacetylase family protein [Myxococcales bacterium]|nr:polysaccharide deacetylase family protein [Myxococcales bacterium]